MTNDQMGWVDERNAELEKIGSEGYFNIVEGDNRIQLLTHCAPLPQVYDAGTRKYRVAEEGDKNISIKGLCWVLQDGKVKQAKLPYTVVKAIRELQNDPDYQFEAFPMPRLINVKAKNAGSKEVEYTVIPSPKEVTVAPEVLTELATKPTPEDVVEKIKNKGKQTDEVDGVKYPEEEVNPEDIPFGN